MKVDIELADIIHNSTLRVILNRELAEQGSVFRVVQIPQSLRYEHVAEEEGNPLSLRVITTPAPPSRG